MFIDIWLTLFPISYDINTRQNMTKTYFVCRQEKIDLVNNCIYTNTFEKSISMSYINEFNMNNLKNVSKEEMSKSFFSFAEKLLNNSKTIEPDFQKFIDEEFWNLI